MLGNRRDHEYCPSSKGAHCSLERANKNSSVFFITRHGRLVVREPHILGPQGGPLRPMSIVQSEWPLIWTDACSRTRERLPGILCIIDRSHQTGLPQEAGNILHASKRLPSGQLAARPPRPPAEAKLRSYHQNGKRWRASGCISNFANMPGYNLFRRLSVA